MTESDPQARERSAYLHAWRASADDLGSLLAELNEADWARPTDCPGWSVRDVVAHVVAIEADLADGVVRAGQPAAKDVVSAEYTQAGVAARADRSPAELAEELRRAVAAREAALTATPPDLDEPAWQLPDGPGWDWRTLLRNRVIDLWVHEQDIRRATARPGGLDSAGADVTVGVFASALPMVIGRRVRPPAGTVVAIDLDGVRQGWRVDESGRCVPAAEGDEPHATVRLSREGLTLLAAGRQEPAQVDVELDGDVPLGRQILAALTLTP